MTVTSGGVADISYGIFRYSTEAIRANCNGNGELAVYDSSFDSKIYATNCAQSALTLERNTFAVPQGAEAFYASNTEPTGISLSGADKNVFTGGGSSKVVRLNNVSIPSSSAWTLSSEGGAVIALDRISIEGSLGVAPATIVKLTNNSSYYGFNVNSEGSLNIDGTSSPPVFFTSFNDDTVGGDSNSDGSSTSPAENDYTSAIAVSNDATVESSNLNIKYADVAVIVTGGEVNLQSTSIAHVKEGLSVGRSLPREGQVIYRGSMDDISSRGIIACNWDQPCSVDAAYVDWGRVDGPFVTSGGNLVCGKVSASPWVVGSSTDSADIFDVENCDSTPTPAQQLSTNASAAHLAVASKRIDCDNGYQAACDAIETYLTCYGAAIQLAASQSPIPVSFDNPTEVVDTTSSTVANASNTFLQGLESGSVPSFNLQVATGMLNVIGIYSALSSAYSSCAP